MDVADGEVAVQGLADGDCLRANVAAAEAELQLVGQADLQCQFDPVRPARQCAERLRAVELENRRIAFAALLPQLPGQGAHQAVEGRGLLAVVARLDLLWVARQIAEPRPAYGYASAYRLALFEGGLLAEPDDRRRIALAIAEDLRALFGDQQFVLTAAYSPAGELVHFDALDIDRHGESRKGSGSESDRRVKAGFRKGHCLLAQGGSAGISVPGRRRPAASAPAV